MERRGFLSMLAATAVTPLLPARAAAPAVAAAGYNRYMYGLAVFQARTRATLTAADLMARLRVPAATAEAMMGEMSAKGVLVPAMNAVQGAMRAVSPQGQTLGQTQRAGVRRAVEALEELGDHTSEPEVTPAISPEDQDIETDHTEAPAALYDGAEQETENGQV